MTDTLADHSAEVRRHLKVNYTVTALEGAMFSCGLAFIEPTAVLPRIIQNLHGPNWLIALMPLLSFAGVTVPQVFVAHRIEKLPRMKPYVVLMGTFQRLAFLLTGLFLLLFSASSPLVVLAAVALTPLLSGIFTGLHVTAWQELVAKTIPANRMSSLWAVRFIIGAVLGMGAGKAVSLILENVPGTTGFGLLYCCTFACALVSIIIISFTRETHLPPKRTGDDYGITDFLRSIVPVIRSDRRLFYFLMVRVFSSGIFVLSPFLGIRALAVLGWPDSSLGAFVTAQMIGALCGYLLGGYVGDTRGARPVIVLNHGFALVLAAWVIGAHTPFEFMAVFFLFGVTSALNMSGTMPLGFQISPTDRRIAYFTVISFAGLPGLLIAWGLSTFGRSLGSGMTWLSLCTMAMMSVSLVFVLLIKPPAGPARRERAEAGTAEHGVAS